ncbi:hypothetical protein QBC38DRAFT_461264 [Podospora fimiseda]|uniref:Uncharacterized protein n=1 Tax=Podospora fimiseda TaxID=252190 RepID=A0AAN6YMS1_9PEZI|nr:hypothetical protein QBC38DRAFT_461264 [Podospora fimiseda]
MPIELGIQEPIYHDVASLRVRTLLAAAAVVVVIVILVTVDDIAEMRLKGIEDGLHANFVLHLGGDVNGLGEHNSSRDILFVLDDTGSGVV